MAATLTGCAAVTLPAGSANSKTATCSTASLAAGTHSIVATYTGDAANTGSTSATLAQVVNGVRSGLGGRQRAGWGDAGERRW